MEHRNLIVGPPGKVSEMWELARTQGLEAANEQLAGRHITGTETDSMLEGGGCYSCYRTPYIFPAV